MKKIFTVIILASIGIIFFDFEVIPNFDIIFTMISSISAAAAAFFSYNSITQVREQSKLQFSQQVRTKTLEVLGDPNNGIPSLARKSDQSRLAQYPILKLNLTEIDKELSLNQRGFSEKSIAKFKYSIEKKLPFGYYDNSQAKIAFEINRYLLAQPFKDGSDERKACADVLNRIEDIATSANIGVLDLEMINQMYGNLLIRVFRENSEFYSFGKRKYGLRTYDQTDTMIDKLIEFDSARYQLFRFQVLIYLVSKGKMARSFVFEIMRNPSRWRQERSLNSLQRAITNRGLSIYLSQITLRARIANFNFSSVSTTTKFLARRSNRKALYKLFRRAYIESGDVWPVNFQSNEAHYQSKKTVDWVSKVGSKWDYHILCTKKSFFREQFVGFIALMESEKILSDEKRWLSEITSGLRDFSTGNETTIFKRVEELGIPVFAKNGNNTIDFSKMCMIKSLYVTDRHNARGQAIGRKLLRKMLAFARYDLGKIPFLTVIADSKFTEQAIKLYVSEGGAYLGTTRDDLKSENHLMHIFIF
ncbi:MAG: hypothetical protein JJ891_12715 [Rhizobiaceae bacterium]|nr:hypothetical protein [Rhizobiaceae bacterium]